MLSHMYTLHEFIDDHFGVGDTRLMYGITVPLLLGVVSISLLIAIAEWWLLAPTVLCVIALTVTVTVGIGRMLNEEDSEPPEG